MSNTYSGVRGTASLDPSQTNSFNRIIQESRKAFNIFGYSEIVLPLLEEEGLFRRSVGDTSDIVQKQMFKIEGKDIVLRPEGTAQVIRYYLENTLYKKSDFYKFSYFGPMFRGERPQRGRLRQFHHIGAEAIGSDSLYLDAEIIGLSMRILEASGVSQKELRINTLGCAEDKKKFSKDLKTMLEDNKDKFCRDCQHRLVSNPLRVLDCKNETCKQMTLSLDIRQNHLCGRCAEQFSKLRLLLEELKISYTYSPCLVRGLDYYTNTVFEIVSRQLGSQDAVGAGGRYNGLVQCLGGPSIPAVGFALGIERIMLVLNQPEEAEKVKVFIATVEEHLKDEAVKLLGKLRDEGISSDMDYMGKSLKGQLRYAQKVGIKFVVILGEDELKEGCAGLKNMETATQDKVRIEELRDKIIVGDGYARSVKM